MSSSVSGAGWTMHHGDCLEVMQTLGEVDHVITDPPYSQHVHNKSRSGARPLLMGDRKTPCFNREAEFGFDALAAETRRVCAREFARLSRRWVIAFSDLELSTWWRLSLVAAGLQWVRAGIWVKEGCTPQFTGDRPAAAVEVINIAHPAGRKRWNGGGRRGIWSVPVVQVSGAHVSERVHTTQKPIDLMRALVADFTDPGETILDPFAGSGTTGVAAIRLGRKFIGIERDEKYFQLACNRLRAEESDSTLQAHRQGQLPLLSVLEPPA